MWIKSKNWKIKQIINHNIEHEVLSKRVMYVGTNTETRSCNYCSSGEAISITYSECIYVALGTQREMRMRYIFICGLSGFAIFFLIVS